MFNVLSFDSSRVRIDRDRYGNRYVYKKTTDTEWENLRRARTHLTQVPLFVRSSQYGSVRVMAAKPVLWDEKTSQLSTPLYKGRNLEFLLRTTLGNHRPNVLDFTKRLFEGFRTHGFMWGDFAPRNILWSQDRRRLHLVDFERELYLHTEPVAHKEFAEYVSRYSREEFSAFLMPHEQLVVFNDITDRDAPQHKLVLIKQIHSKRKRAILDVCFCLSTGECPVQTLRTVEELMTNVATPFWVNNRIITPIDVLDIIGNKGGPYAYARTVQMVQPECGIARLSALQACAAAFGKLPITTH